MTVSLSAPKKARARHAIVSLLHAARDRPERRRRAWRLRRARARRGAIDRWWQRVHRPCPLSTRRVHLVHRPPLPIAEAVRQPAPRLRGSHGAQRSRQRLRCCGVYQRLPDPPQRRRPRSSGERRHRRLSKVVRHRKWLRARASCRHRTSRRRACRRRGPAGRGRSSHFRRPTTFVRACARGLRAQRQRRAVVAVRRVQRRVPARATRPVSTGGRTRRVQLVREEGRDASS
jgi:hypothetical protein